MSDGMGREPAYLSSHATNRYFIPNWGSVLKSFMMTRQFVGSSGKWSDRVVCVVSMQPAKWGKQHEQQVQRITTFRLEQSCREVNNMIPPGSCKSLPPNDEMT